MPATRLSCCPTTAAPLPATFALRTIYQSKLIEYDEERNLAVFWVRWAVAAACWVSSASPFGDCICMHPH